ncbi:hypothetical protein WN51_07649 [Melipona quadrifasciata]|uniref:Uncharacterized protein n=1 Tax=Melipona quadrifasciata TaxID=166423 RepID=A0A0M8ZQB2_9HYME|nr:hypothetical protein WN51_07649 [Melipona quadrifasciata]
MRGRVRRAVSMNLLLFLTAKNTVFEGTTVTSYTLSISDTIHHARILTRSRTFAS